MENVKVFVNGNIITCDEYNNTAQAMAIYDGRFIAVGTNEEITSLVNSKENTFDLNDSTVIPGLIDSHVHMTQTGLNKLGVTLSTAESVQDMLKAIEKSELLKNNDLVFGIGYDDSKIVEKRPPTMKELDRVAPEKFIWLGRVDSHSCVVNSKMFKYLNLTDKLSGVDLDENGEPTGVLRAQANSIARKKMLQLIDDDMRRKALEIASSEAVSKGVTTLNALEGGPLFNDRDFEVINEYKDKLPIDVEVFFQTTDVDKAVKLGLKRMGGCIILDGSFGSRTAALFEPYNDDSSTNGVLYFTKESLNELVLKAHKNNLQLAFHALGERAINQILDAYEYAQDIYFRDDHRHRIEHFELPTIDQIKRAARLGIIISLQPAFDYFWGGSNGMYAERLGVKRTKRIKPCRQIIDSGCLIIGGSDSDVTPIDPMLGVHAAVNHSNPDQRISVEEALKMFTINGAKAIFKENEKGSIEKGKLADFVVISENPYQINVEKIKEINVIQTYKNGRVVYAK